MKMKLLVGVLVFLILINLATIGTFVYFRFIAHRPPGGPEFGGPPGRPNPMMGMDESQKEKFRVLMDGLRDETADLREKAEQLERRTFELMQETNPSQENIDKNLGELSAVRLELSKKFTHKLLEAKSFLTPEQQKMIFRSMGGDRPGGPPFGRLHGGPGMERDGVPPPPPPEMQ